MTRHTSRRVAGAGGTTGSAAGGKSMKHRFDTVDNGDTHGASQFAAYLLLRNDKLSFALRYGYCRYVANNMNAPCLIWLLSFPETLMDYERLAIFLSLLSQFNRLSSFFIL